MAAIPVRRFSLHTTPGGFQDWLNAYGKTAIGHTERAGRQRWHYWAIPGADVFFEFDTDPDNLDVIAELVTGSDENGWTFNDDPAALAAFEALVKASKRKFGAKEGARAGTLARAAEMHQLLKSGECKSYTQANAIIKKKFGKMIDPRVYQDYCAEATGEPPIYLREK